MKTENFQIAEHFCFHDKAVYDKLSYFNIWINFNDFCKHGFSVNS